MGLHAPLDSQDQLASWAAHRWILDGRMDDCPNWVSVVRCTPAERLIKRMRTAPGLAPGLAHGFERTRALREHRTWQGAADGPRHHTDSAEMGIGRPLSDEALEGLKSYRYVVGAPS